MITELFIEKHRERIESEDFFKLRGLGIEHIQRMVHEIWTDYNVHDPGITTLEVLCYALTDLSHRTGYKIQDILAEETISGAPDIKNFFSARQILTCNPVTVNDFRKIMIDVPGVKNAWLQPAESVKPDLYLDCKNGRLTLETTDKYDRICVQGLYDITLEFEKDPELGNLNIYYFEREVGQGEDSFLFTVILPPWHLLFNQKIAPEQIDELEFIELSSVEKTQKYEGKLRVTLKDGSQTDMTVTITSKGIKNDTNLQLIRDELNRKDENSLLTNYQNLFVKATGIAEEVLQSFHQHRNLCEDLHSFKAIELEEIKICADLEVTAEADIEAVLAEMYYRIGQFLAPQVNFYTLEELRARGKTAGEIFEGPPLNHGFIDDAELEFSKFRETIHVSDIMQIIMDVEGVAAVKTILIANFFNGEPQTDGEEWCLQIGANRVTRLSVDRSKIVFYKGLIPYAAKKDEMLIKLSELLSLDRQNRLGYGVYNLEIPGGQYKGIQAYTSIQNEYPLVYGIGAEGLLRSATKGRKAQAKQFKAYLLFYDQLLANYFAQLAHVKDLFSMNSEIKKTYFTQPLYEIPDLSKPDVPNIENLIKEFVESLDLANHPEIDIDDLSSYESKWQDFLSDRKSTFFSEINDRESQVESKDTYEDRKNRFLDHLMARFCEQFTDYVMLMYSLDRKRAPADLIEDKLAFLNDYPEISHNRGKAFNYKEENEIWESDNVSGLQKRVSRLLGIESYTRQFLSPFRIYLEADDDGVDEFRFRLIDKEGNILLSSSTQYLTREDAYQEMHAVVEHGRNNDNFKIETTVEGRFYFNLINENEEIIARRIDDFETEEEANEKVDEVVAFLQEGIDCEGFHLIEHILLRPEMPDDQLLTVCVPEDCNTCSGFADPYSFRITVAVPYWPERFENMDFRRFFESTIRMEAPAHTHVKICWVDFGPMSTFEEKYLAWLEENSKKMPDMTVLTQLQNDLIKALESLRSVYPRATLHDCEEAGEENPVLLNYTVLGSTKKEEDGDM